MTPTGPTGPGVEYSSPSRTRRLAGYLGGSQAAFCQRLRGVLGLRVACLTSVAQSTLRALGVGPGASGAQEQGKSVGEAAVLNLPVPVTEARGGCHSGSLGSSSVRGF